jgi:hypothetical protein
MIAPDTSLSNVDNVLKFAIDANDCYTSRNMNMAYLNLNVALTFAVLIGDGVYSILNTAAKNLETEIDTKKYSSEQLFDVFELLTALQQG